MSEKIDSALLWEYLKIFWEKTFNSYLIVSSALGVHVQLFSEKNFNQSLSRLSASMKFFIEQFMFGKLRISENIFSFFGSRSLALHGKDLMFFSEMTFRSEKTMCYYCRKF